MTIPHIITIATIVLLSVLTGSLATKIIDSKEYCNLYNKTLEGLK
jgi:hypothetical protein